MTDAAKDNKRNAELLSDTVNKEIYSIHFDCCEEDKNSKKLKNTSAQIFDSGELYHYKILD